MGIKYIDQRGYKYRLPLKMSSFVESAEMFAPAKGRPWEMNPAISIQINGERLSILDIKVKESGRFR